MPREPRILPLDGARCQAIKYPEAASHFFEWLMACPSRIDLASRRQMQTLFCRSHCPTALEAIYTESNGKMFDRSPLLARICIGRIDCVERLPANWLSGQAFRIW